MIAAAAAAIDTRPPKRIVQRGPHASPIHPTKGAPIGVVPMKIAMYNAITRPRMAGATVICTVAFAVVSRVRALRPTGISASAKVQ